MAKEEKSKKDKITGDMSIGDVVRKWPETAGTFAEHGMHCVGCAIAAFESIEMGAKAHGMHLEKLLKDLNKVASKNKEE